MRDEIRRVALVVTLSAITVAVVQLGWNVAVTHLLPLPPVGYWQTWALLVGTSALLFWFELWRSTDD